MDGFCRGCLIHYDDPNQFLHYTEKNRRQFVYVTGIQVKSKDAIPLQVCRDCYVNMQVSCKFKKQCRTSDKRFRSYLALREAGDNVDLRTFIKNTEDPFTYRLNSVQHNCSSQKSKEDFNDNESACTSMMNFVTDILTEDDIPGAEANLIKEVIEEETDIMDDTLDSHWLQDDASIDTDFQLDFSFSPLQSQRKVNSPIVANADTGANKIKCPIDTNLARALQNINKQKCFIEDLLLSPPEVRASSTPLPGYPAENGKNNIMRGVNDTDDFLEDYVGKGKSIKGCGFYKENEQNNYGQKQEEHNGLGKDMYWLRSYYKGKKNVAEELERSNKLQESTVSKHMGKEAMIDEDFHFTQELERHEDGEIKYAHAVEQNIEDKMVVSSNDIEIHKDQNSDLSDGEDNLRVEIYVHVPKVKMLCIICKEEFKRKKLFISHHAEKHNIKLIMKDKVTRKPAVCDVCGKVFKNPSNIKSHLKLHERESEGSHFECDTCHMVFTKKMPLIQHMKSHEYKISDIPKVNKAFRYICTKCSYTSNIRSNLNLHMRRHNKDFKVFCDECDKGFYRKSDFFRHKRNHTGSKPFQCTMCSKRFARIDYLTKHLRGHTGERPFVCGLCGATYKQLNDLNYHRRRMCPV